MPLSHTVLTDPTYTVPVVPDATTGVAWLRASVARFSEGATHDRRRALAQADIAADIAIVSPCYQPHTAITDEADHAVDRLIKACGGVADEATANRIGLLVQAGAAIDALLTGKRPPVPVTRRVASDGTTVEVDLTDAPLGAEPHACPGEAIAIAIAAGRMQP
ncbi:MAG TPA: hypothetical protein VFX16_02775 [Pseudonocardiaceae bacterium]|nr:hypothetical protein [Pseudonocardiaceae bacterium]